jgi:hypothetical protein
MPQQTKVFRVFVSSTFNDMKEERWILQRYVFPRLERFCEQRGARFQAVDLRWGVNEESQKNQKTLDICLSEIERCQKLSPKPNFLILLGNRYGWQPIPSKIPEKEMDQIVEIIKKNDADKRTLFWDEEDDTCNGWYRLDTNAIPAEYVLRKRTGTPFEAEQAWIEEENRIREILQKAVKQTEFKDDEKKNIKYFASATHQEILKGALSPPEGKENPEEHVLAFVREIEGMPLDETAKDFFEHGSVKRDKDAIDPPELIGLKNELKGKLGHNYIEYTTKWDGKKSVNPNEVKCAALIYKKLARIIDHQIKNSESKDEIEQEKKLHEEFKNTLARHFRGRTTTLENIAKYLNDPSTKKVLSLIGSSGSGKSSVMAKAIENLKDDPKRKNGVLAYRFIGVTSASTNVISLLRSLCAEMAAQFGETLESIAGKEQEKSLYEIYGLTEVLRKCMALATSEKRVVLFLDALNQLSETDNAKALYWLPKELREHVKIIVSSLPELENSLSETQTEQLPLLPQQEAEDILDLWFDHIKRTLTDDQKKKVLSAFDQTRLPIFLKVAFEIAKHWHSFEHDETLKNDISGIINDFFDSLKNDGHDPAFVQTALSYMLCGKYSGLTENEILEILVFDKEFWGNVFLGEKDKKGICHPDHKEELIQLKERLEKPEKGPKVLMKIPIVLWSRLFLDLEPFLTEKDADGVPIITFFHQQFFEVLKERYELIEEVIESL